MPQRQGYHVRQTFADFKEYVLCNRIPIPIRSSLSVVDYLNEILRNRYPSWYFWAVMRNASTEKVWQDRNKLQSGNVWHPQTKVDGLESEKDRIRIRFQLGLVWFPEFNVCCHENHLIRDVTDLKRRFVAFTVPVAKPIIKLCPANYVFDGNLSFEDCFVAGLTAQEDSFRYSLLFRRRLP